nr:MAG TPA: hypothetical protein [Bacteriophage sp.]
MSGSLHFTPFISVYNVDNAEANGAVALCII